MSEALFTDAVDQLSNGREPAVIVLASAAAATLAEHGAETRPTTDDAATLAAFDDPLDQLA